jgi:DNA-binding transcriptional LysR family regulator
MLDLTRLRVLQHVATTGSLAGAAEALSLTPSAVSQQMTKLEREVRARLLERNGRGVRLTQAGVLLVRHATRILSAVESAEAELDEQRGTVSGEFGVGVFATAARGLMPGVIATLAQRHPDLEVRMYEVEPEAALAQVGRGELDLAVVQDWESVPLPKVDGVACLELGLDVLDVALPADHPFAARDNVSLEELAGENWIASTAGSLCHDWLAVTYRNQGFEPRFRHHIMEFPTQLALIAAGLGVALIPRLARTAAQPGVRYVPVRPTVHRRISVSWRDNTGRRPAVRAVVTALRDQWAAAA